MYIRQSLSCLFPCSKGKSEMIAHAIQSSQMFFPCFWREKKTRNGIHDSKEQWIYNELPLLNNLRYINIECFEEIETFSCVNCHLSYWRAGRCLESFARGWSLRFEKYRYIKKTVKTIVQWALESKDKEQTMLTWYFDFVRWRVKWNIERTTPVDIVYHSTNMQNRNSNSLT